MLLYKGESMKTEKSKNISVIVLCIMVFVMIVVAVIISDKNNRDVQSTLITETTGIESAEIKAEGNLLQSEALISSESHGTIYDDEIKEGGENVDKSEEISAQITERIERMMKESERFGYYVSENIIKREVPLAEKDFEQLKKGQYLHSNNDSALEPEGIGIAEMIGMYDGIIYYNPIALFHGNAKTGASPYYKIDEDTYVILLFREKRPDSFPLESVEVWDAEGNKLHDINIQ